MNKINPFKPGDKVVAADNYRGGAISAGKVYIVDRIQRNRVVIKGLYADGSEPLAGLGSSCFRAAVAGKDYPAVPAPAPNDLYPSGHLADGSSVQKHSAGPLYPYVLVYRDSTDPHSQRKYDIGLIGPAIIGEAWFTSMEHAINAAEGLQP